MVAARTVKYSKGPLSQCLVHSGLFLEKAVYHDGLQEDQLKTLDQIWTKRLRRSPVQFGLEPKKLNFPPMKTSGSSVLCGPQNVHTGDFSFSAG